jgi:dTDP-4-amino-4,6-dideoxygalactose transaminase
MLARVRSNLTLRNMCSAAFDSAEQPAEALERAFAARFGFPHGVLFPYGRSALNALLRTLGWRERTVLCPAYVCAELPYAATLSQNQVRLVDSAHDHFLPGPPEWRAAATPDCAMAVITPLFGYPIDPTCLEAIRASAPNVFVLCDEAQSYGATDRQGLQMRHADAALFSLGLGKMVTALSGGVLLLRDHALHRALRAFRDSHYASAGLAQVLKRVARGTASWLAFREPALSLVDLLARTFSLFPVAGQDWLPAEVPRLPADADLLPASFQSRIGLRQLALLDGLLAERRRIGEHYEHRLREEGFRTFSHVGFPTWSRYPFAIAERDRTAAALRSRKIQVSLFLPYSCARLPIYCAQAERCPSAAIWARSMINLPNWHGLGIGGAERVVESLLRIRDRDPLSLAWPER